jgi:glycosyltransferase involved in cell wall biosynthesis
MGFRNNVAKILQASDVFIMPSFYEPFGLSTVEAMSCELPVIATAQGGTAEIVEDEISGFLLPAADPKMIAEKMIYLFNTPDKAATMGKHGQTVAKTKFSLSRCTQTIQEAIEEVYSQ